MNFKTFKTGIRYFMHSVYKSECKGIIFLLIEYL